MADPEYIIEGMKPGDYILLLDRRLVSDVQAKNLPYQHWRERGIFVQVLRVYDIDKAARLLRVEPSEGIHAK